MLPGRNGLEILQTLRKRAGPNASLDPDRTRRRRGPSARPRPRCRRLSRQAVCASRAARPRPRTAAAWPPDRNPPIEGRRPRARRHGTACHARRARPGSDRSRVRAAGVSSSPQGHVVSREMLAHDVWKEPRRATPIDNVIDVQVARLRRKVDVDGRRAPDSHGPRRGVRAARGRTMRLPWAAPTIRARLTGWYAACLDGDDGRVRDSDLRRGPPRVSRAAR